MEASPVLRRCAQCQKISLLQELRNIGKWGSLCPECYADISDFLNIMAYGYNLNPNLQRRGNAY